MTRKHKIIVSMTTISARIQFLKKVLESILKQQLKPDLVYLFISREPYLKDEGIPEDEIPDYLLRLEKNSALKIEYTENTGPYRKLIPALSKHFKEACVIVTADDDTLYPRHWISQLYESYLRFGQVVCYRARIMAFENGVLEPYSKWGRIRNRNWQNPDFCVPTGKDGVLYAPAFFDERIFDRSFLELCPTADDIWFRFMTMMRGVGAIVIKSGFSFPEAVHGHYRGLKFDNYFKGRNDEQIQGVIRFFRDKYGFDFYRYFHEKFSDHKKMTGSKWNIGKILNPDSLKRKMNLGR